MSPHRDQPTTDLAAGSHAFVKDFSFDKDYPLELSHGWHNIGDGLEIPSGDYIVFAKVGVKMWSIASQGQWVANPPPPDVSGNAQLELTLGMAKDDAHVSVEDAPRVEVRIVSEQGGASYEEAVTSVSNQAEVDQIVSLILAAHIDKPDKVRLSGKGQAAFVNGARIVAMQLDKVTMSTWSAPSPKRPEIEDDV